ncbi:hypothetical protein L835_2945 [Mycobacteroides abscessus MAB_110811_1470]|nr:hypothetical protein L835_2945 [Mycobacteroides abscessus MAB_110811_1470]
MRRGIDPCSKPRQDGYATLNEPSGNAFRDPKPFVGSITRPNH